MAIFHLQSQIIGRTSGKSAVASAAYRAGEKIYDEHTVQTFDYKRKQGVDYKEILAPDHAPAWVQDRGRLWNEVEKSEKRINSQLSRELNIALPKELSKDQQIELIRNFAKEQFVAKGMIADLAMHNLAGGNPHAHIMLTTREIGPEGLGKKNREWNDREVLKDWRKEWSSQTNKALEKADVLDRVDHRSLKDQGIKNQIPQIHIGVQANAMEKRGDHTERGDKNRAILEANKDMKQYKKDNVALNQDKKQYQVELGEKGKVQPGAPISEQVQKNVQQPRTLEQVKQEVKSARAEVNKAYEDMSYQVQIVGDLNNKLKNTNFDLKKYDQLDEEIEKVGQELGKINHFHPLKQIEKGKERDLLVKQKQSTFGSADREEIKHKISKLEKSVQVENKKLNGLEKRFEQSSQKFGKVNTEAQRLERGINQKNRTTGQPVRDTIKALSSSFEKVQQIEKSQGERIKQNIERKAQAPQKGKGRGRGRDQGDEIDY